MQLIQEANLGPGRFEPAGRALRLPEDRGVGRPGERLTLGPAGLAERLEDYLGIASAGEGESTDRPREAGFIADGGSGLMGLEVVKIEACLGSCRGYGAAGDLPGRGVGSLLDVMA
ncbi:MAG: hypothetical protein AAGG38_13180 [Planctomycetota bacterium]